MTRAMEAVSSGRRATREPRWLRWALVRDARIEHEAVVPPDQSVSVGVGGDVPTRDAKRALAWFVDGRWTLALAPAWRGRIGAKTLAELDAKKADDGTAHVVLDEGAHVRIELGDAAVLMQLVDRPPARTKPTLPASLRGGLLQRADWWFTAFVTGSLILHLAVVAFVLEADWPVEQALLPDRFVEVIFPEAPEPPDHDVPPETMSDDRDPSRHVDATEPNDVRETVAQPSRSPRRPSRGAPNPSMDPNEEARQALAATQLQIGALLGAPGSAMRDLIENGAPTAGQQAILEQSTGMLASNGDPGAVRERPGAGCVGCDGERGLGALAASSRGGQRMSEGDPVPERVIPLVVPDPEGPIIDPAPGFDTRDLLRAIRARMPAVQRCYEHELTQGSPDTEGRITIRLTVMPVGTVSGVRAIANNTGSDALAACTERSLGNIRVRVGPEEPIDVEYPMVFHHPH